MPQEIGAAAAYEAYRQIKYSTNVYNFLYSDYERQVEAIRGLAIAETVRLWQDTGRTVDQVGLQMACDSAAATANYIVAERELEDPHSLGVGYGSYRDRRNSFGAMSSYGGSAYGGGSVYGGSSPLRIGGNLPPSPMSGSIPIPGSPYSGAGVPYAGGFGMPMSYGGYPGSYGTPGYEYLGVPGAYSMGGYASHPGTPGAVIISPPEDHHRHHRRSHSRRHHHHRRHRSHDRY